MLVIVLGILHIPALSPLGPICALTAATIDLVCHTLRALTSGQRVC